MKRRVLMGMLLDNDTGRAFHAPLEPTADELDAITRRQAMRVIARADLDAHTKRTEASRRVAFICFVVVFFGAVAALVTCFAHHRGGN